MIAEEYIEYHRLKPGDIIVSCFQEKKGGLKSLFHFVTYLGANQAIHNVPDAGVCLLSMDDVAENYREVHRVERFKGDENALQGLYKRAREVLGRSYDLLSFNCESLANYLRYGKATSKQVIAISIMVALMVLAFIAFVLGLMGTKKREGGGMPKGRSNRDHVNVDI